MLDRSGQLDLLIFDDLVKRRAEMLDSRESEALIGQGQIAIQRRDRNALRNINTRLRGLLPVPPPQPDPFSTVRAG